MFQVFLRIFTFLGKWLRRITPFSVITYARALVATLIGYAAMWALRGLVLAHPEVAFRIITKIAQYYYTPPEMWAAFVNSYISQMTGEEISVKDLTRLGARVGGRQVIERIGETFLAPMLGLIMPEPPLTFEKGVDSAERFLGVNLQFQLNAWLLHLIGDIVSLGKLKSLKDLPNAISWSYGIGWLSWLIMGEPFRIATVEPLKKGLNKIYTPELLTPTQAVWAYWAGLIDSTQLQEELLEQGFNPDRIALLAEYHNKKFDDTELKKLYQENLITQQQIEDELRFKGFSPWHRKLLTFLITHDRLLKLRDKLIDHAIDLFIKGKISESDLKNYLTRANYSSKEQDLIINIALLEKAKYATPSDSEIKKAFDKGYISYAEAKSMLLNRGWDERWADIILDVLKKEK